MARGRELPKAALRLPPDNDLPGHLQPLAALLAAWMSQQARDLSIDGPLLATRADLEAYLRRDPDNRLSRGWRAELAGASLARIVDGSAAVGYERSGRLVLVDRI